MKWQWLLVLIVASHVSQHIAAATKQYEMQRSESIIIKNSENLGHYQLYIKLPEDYQTNADSPSSTKPTDSTEPALKRYPVIYTTDADWHMDLLSGTTAYLFSDVILVGISWQMNMPENLDYGERRKFASRFRDYSFLPHSSPEIQKVYQFGQADRHLRFIRNDVIPYLEKHYRVSHDERAYLGYSMGAEFGAFVLIDAADTFKYYLLGSPSLDEKSLGFLETLDTQREKEPQSATTHVFVSIGEQESSTMELTQNFLTILRRNEDQSRHITDLHIVKDADHSSAVPESFITGIKWLKQKVSENRRAQEH